MPEDNLKLIVLKEKFELLKDAYNKKDDDPLSIFYRISENIIAPVLDIDVETGIQMWEYMLNKYYNRVGEIECHDLTDMVIEHTKSYECLESAFERSNTICECVAMCSYDNHWTFYEFIGELLYHSNYKLAQKLVDLLLKNTNGNNNPEKNLYKLCDSLLFDKSKWELDSVGLDFVYELIKKIDNKVNRSKLEVKFIDVAECVENGAPRGAMPFSLFTKEGGLERFLENKAREKKEYSVPKYDSFTKYNEQRKKRQMIQKQKSSKPPYINEDELNVYRSELENLVGLEDVKREVNSLVNLIHVNTLRKSRNFTVPETSQHLVFTGNPGTGKTTVARLIGKLYHALGFLSNGSFTEVDRSGLVAGYVGQTALKTKEVITKALGGVLFIDEAYSLAPKYKEDFGAEAIETLLKAMEDYRDDFVVIVAGYDELMEEFINSNPGLKSRFNKTIHFPDYSSDELLKIFLMLLDKNNYIVDSQCVAFLDDYFKKLYNNRDEHFGNAREVRNLFEKVIANQANRIVNISNPTDEEILEISIEDFTV